MTEQIESRLREASQPYLDQCSEKECNCSVCNERIETEKLLRSYYDMIAAKVTTIMPIIDIEEDKFWQGIDEFMADEKLDKK